MNNQNKPLRKFKLIDKEGFLGAHYTNYRVLEKLRGGVLEGYIDEDGDLLTHNDYVLLLTTEFKYFKEVTNLEEETPLENKVRGGVKFKDLSTEDKVDLMEHLIKGGVLEEVEYINKMIRINPESVYNKVPTELDKLYEQRNELDKKIKELEESFNK